MMLDESPTSRLGISRWGWHAACNCFGSMPTLSTCSTPEKPRRSGRRAAWWGIAALVVGLLHCGDTDRNEQPGAVLHITWTIEDDTLASRCDELGAPALQATVFFRGDIVASYEAPCSAFELTTEPVTPNDEYMVRATLVDDLDVAKSRTVSSSEFSLSAAEVLELSINFDMDALVEQ
jgi:hypothetical protein